MVFSILALAPGDPLSGFASNPEVPPEVRENIRRQFGLDQPVFIRYFKWLIAMSQGDWGYSFGSLPRSSGSSVSGYRRPFLVIGSAYVISVLIAVPLGVITAVRQYSWLDQLVTVLSFIWFSLPTFFTGLMLIIIFSVKLGWLPMIYNQLETNPLLMARQMAIRSLCSPSIRLARWRGSFERRCSTISDRTTFAPPGRRG